MNIEDKIIVIASGASGIGVAMAHCFAREGAKHIVCADRNLKDAQAVADEFGGTALQTDVARGRDRFTDRNSGSFDRSY